MLKKLKKEIGTAIPTSGNTYLMKGRDIRSGTPKEISLKEEDTAEALKPGFKPNSCWHKRCFRKNTSRTICRFSGYGFGADRRRGAS